MRGYKTKLQIKVSQLFSIFRKTETDCDKNPELSEVAERSENSTIVDTIQNQAHQGDNTQQENNCDNNLQEETCAEGNSVIQTDVNESSSNSNKLAHDNKYKKKLNENHNADLNCVDSDQSEPESKVEVIEVGGAWKTTLELPPFGNNIVEIPLDDIEVVPGRFFFSL